MAGYFGYSMSNRAVEAYARGLKPATKMVAYLKKRYPRTFRGLTPAILRSVLGRGEEWHHTSAKYNCTEFYSVQQVFDNREDLKAELAAMAGEKALRAALKRAGRDVLIMDDGRAFGSIQFCRDLDGVCGEYARHTLKLSAAEYTAAVEKHNAEMAAIAAERNRK